MDPDALARLLDRHAAALELYARPWCDAPEDVVQEAFVALAAQRPAPGNPAAWLFTAVRNRAINAGTAARRRRVHEARAASEAPAWFEPSSSSPLDAGTAEAALRTLADDRRQVIVAHLWGGLSFEEVGRLIGASSSTAHRLYHAGLKDLRVRLGVSWNRPNPGTKTQG